MTDVFVVDTKQGIQAAVNEIFSQLEKTGPILKSSKEKKSGAMGRFY